MDGSKQVFKGKNGKLVLKGDKISIVRKSAQAMENKSGRITELNISDIDTMRHRYAADKPGYIEFKTKLGSDAGSIINRRHRVDFDVATAHRFRRAQKQIARQIKSEADSMPSASSNPADLSAPQIPNSVHRPMPYSPANTKPLTQNESNSVESDFIPPSVPSLVEDSTPIEDNGLPYRGLLG